MAGPPAPAIPVAPVATERPAVDLYFDIGNGRVVDASTICDRFKFKCMMNGGYIISGRLKDANFNITRQLLIDSEYLKLARSRIFKCQFRLKWSTSGNRTPLQTAYVSGLHASGGVADSADLEFVAIDPPSWHLSTGDSYGGAFRGNVGEVIKKVVARYAPGITLNVSETVDSSTNRFWMMTMDPKSFILSLLDWSSSLTRGRTQWIVGMDDTIMQIKAQDEIPSRHVASYVGPHGGAAAPTIRAWELLADNALSIMGTKLTTQGASAVSGQYLDMTAADGAATIVDDSNTPKKYKARVNRDKSFTKPAGDRPPAVGFTTVQSIPEVYSAGEVGRRYRDYIDGRPRGVFLNMQSLVMRCRFRVIGHGVFYNGLGLGTDTITVQWLDIDGIPFILSGNWIVYGFEHIYKIGSWVTDVYCARLDHDANAVAVPQATR